MTLGKEGWARAGFARGESVNGIELCPTGAVAVVSSTKGELPDPVIFLCKGTDAKTYRDLQA